MRPISLLNCSIKLITKILANRLQLVILQLVQQNQYGFIKNRSIQDCLAWSFEYLHLCYHSKKKMVILKLDFEKVFDKIEHEVIIQVMAQKGFPMKWIEWIKDILSSGTSSIMLNGTLGKVFHCKRGVRQGVPLSPLLFVLAADLLQSVINKAKDNVIRHIPLQVGYTFDFPIIQHVDDTILILEACPIQLYALKAILNTFADSTGLRVNYSKSNIYPINITDSELHHLASTFQCQVGAMLSHIWAYPYLSTNQQFKTACHWSIEWKEG
jgi:hypothetical protein